MDPESDRTLVSDSGKSDLVQSEKSDSGMEDPEESFHQSAGSDNEDEMVGKKRAGSKRRRLIIDDDEEEEDEKKDESNSKVDRDDVNESQSSLNEEPPALKITLDNQPGHEMERKDHEGDVEGEKPKYDEESENSDAELSQNLKFDFKNNDLFDAESSDDERPSIVPGSSQSPKRDDNKSGRESESSGDEGHATSGEDENDEGFDESQLDPELLAKLKKFKGAAKKASKRESYARKSKPSAEKMLEIYSESQRLLRGSRINLPYHEPEAKTLDDFLARASRKKKEYAGLKHAKDIHKAQVIHDKLSVHPPALPTSRKKAKHLRTETLLHNEAECSGSTLKNGDDSGVASQDVSTSQEMPLLSQGITQSQSEPSQDTLSQGVLSQTDSHEAASYSQEIASQSSTVVLQPSQETETYQVKDSVDENNDEDELPDLQPVASGHTPLLNAISSQNDSPVKITNFSGENIGDHFGEGKTYSSQEKPSDITNRVPISTSEVSNHMEISDDNPASLFIPSLQKDPSRDLFRSQSTINDDNEMVEDAGVGDACPSGSQSTTNTDVIKSNLSENNQQTLAETFIVETPASNSLDESGSLENTSINTNPATSGEIEPHHEKPKTPKRNLLDKLQALNLPELPRLSGTPHELICLDEASESTTPKVPGLLKLMDRLAQHSKKRTPKPAHDVSLSIIEKEGEEGEKKELKLKTLTYHVPEENEVIPSDTPGSKLSILKQQLGVGMRKKREEARQRRQQLYALENEEGFEGEEKEEEDAEEAEMTDGSSSSEEEEDEEEDVLMNLDAHGDDSADEKDYNPLLDTEAREDDDYSDYDEDSEDVHLRFEVSDEEEEEGSGDEEEADDKNDGDVDEDDEIEEISMTSLKKKRKSQVIQSDAEDGEEEKEDTSSLKAVKESDSVDDFHWWSSEMTPMTKHLQDTQTQHQSRFRRDNSRSPDLYSVSAQDESESNSLRNFDHMNDSSQSVGSYNPHSQMLDADGFLKLTQTQRHAKSKISMLADGENSCINDNEFGSSLKMSAGNIFRGSASQAVGNEEDENMRELMGLCSGTFGENSNSEDAFPSSQNGLISSQRFQPRCTASDEEDIHDPFNILSDVEDQESDLVEPKGKKRVLSDSEDERTKDEDENNDREADTDVEEEDTDAEEEEVTKFTGFKEKKKGIRKEFVDEEAELSGSEFDSDENLDLAEEEDILEEEEGDRDMAGVSEEKLRNEVGKLHMKQLQDEDERDVMRFKEMYLQDGDLYSEGAGRMRNFKWKDIDQSSQNDMFDQSSDDEEGEEEAEETKWRKDRYEREKFLEDSEPNLDDNSQLLKFGQFFIKKKECTVVPLKEVTASHVKEKMAPPEPPKPKMPRKGSFLSRSKETLVKIAQVAKGTLGSSTKNSRNFVFQAMDAQESQDENISTPQPPKRKAHCATHTEQVVKKQKIADSTPPSRPQVKRQSSIFNLLDK